MYSKDLNEHLGYLRQVLILIREHNHLDKLFNSFDKSFLQTSPSTTTIVIHPPTIVGNFNHVLYTLYLVGELG